MWYDRAVIKILFAIAKFMAKNGDKICSIEIQLLENEIFGKENKKEEENK